MFTLKRTILGTVAAAVALGSAAVGMSAGHATVIPHTTRTVQLIHPLHATAPVTRRTPAVVSYTVHAGDTLTAIAGHLYRNPDAWPVLYWANHARIRWADIILPGQNLRVPALPARIPAGPAALAPPPPPPPAPVRQAAVAAAVPAAATGYRQTATDTSYTAGDIPGGAFGRCVVSRESGGNTQVMNATGHYGLYQFAYGTWAHYGGNPGDFGHASAAEQNRVFANAIAAGGQSNWSPYDGC